MRHQDWVLCKGMVCPDIQQECVCMLRTDASEKEESESLEYFRHEMMVHSVKILERK